MKVVIADDHKIVRMGLSMIVESEIAGAEITEAGNAAEVLKILAQKDTDMMLMDLKMPDTDSVGLLEHALVILPKLKVLVVSDLLLKNIIPSLLVTYHDPCIQANGLVRSMHQY